MEKMQQMEIEHENEKRKREQDYDEKMQADKARYEDLRLEKEEQVKKFDIRMSQIYDSHVRKMDKMNKDHQAERDDIERKKKELSAKIETMI